MVSHVGRRLKLKLVLMCLQSEIKSLFTWRKQLFGFYDRVLFFFFNRCLFLGYFLQSWKSTVRFLVAKYKHFIMVDETARGTKQPVTLTRDVKGIYKKTKKSTQQTLTLTLATKQEKLHRLFTPRSMLVSLILCSRYS